MKQVKNGNNSRKWAVVGGAGIIICMMSMPGWAQYGGGSGMEGDPFLISDPNHIQAIGEHEEHWAAGTHFKLVEDIDLSRFTGTGFNIIGYYNSDSDKKPFNGVFDGNSHKIYNFTYSTGLERNGVGLFGYLGSDGEIKDLGLEGLNITTEGVYLGGLVGYNYGGDISNCYATGAVNGGDRSYYLGGLVGENWYGTISNCYSTGAVIGGDDSKSTGGLVGYNLRGDISNCFARGAVSGGVDSYGLGGLVGHNYYGTIINCYARGAVSGDCFIGGFLGYNSYGTISNCYANGKVTAGDESYYIGGLVGRNKESTISNCYANGAVTSGDGTKLLGGLVGVNLESTISNCYATGVVSGDDYLGGLVGHNIGTISNSYATGSVTGVDGSDYLGGLVGYNNSSISDCYATGSVIGGVESEFFGGLVGYNYYGDISDCYASGAVTGGVGSENLGGLVGYHQSGSYIKSFWDNTVNSGMGGIGNTSDPDVIGESTDNMQKADTFINSGWDFVGESANGDLDYWRLCVDDVEYPKLSWQFLDGDLLCPDGVGLLDLWYFVSHWLEIDCDASNNYCWRADINYDGLNNLLDYSLLSGNWLKIE